MIFLYYGLFVLSPRVRVVLRYLLLVSHPSQFWHERTSQYVVAEHSADCCAGDRKDVKALYRPKPTQRSPMSSRSPWTKIPTHMLNMPSLGSFGQLRAYSSDSKDDSDGGFGFQSLGSLFPAPPSPGRYSRPRERRAEEAALKESEERAPEAQSKDDSAPNGAFFQPVSPSDKIEWKPSGESAAPSVDSSTVLHPDGERPLLRRVITKYQEPSTSVDDAPVTAPRGGRERGPAKRAQTAAKPRAQKPPQVDRKVPKPPATAVDKSAPSDKAAAEIGPDPKAWGLSQEDQDTIASIAEPSVPLTARAQHVEAKSTKDASAAPVKSPKADKDGKRLTHVKSSGEAHMVDVGDKPSTKRTAIAVAHIGLTQDVYDQIIENNNRKGDVLGIARIAGIMAAKRTSDIIPLCHPLAISKAEVDVYLVPSTNPNPDRRHYWYQSRPAGQLVAIQARVECVGPTGVEMEALTAVQGAALTIIDMCKAVSKSLTIDGAKVVYKAGGRSGAYCDPQWKHHIGLQKVTENEELKEGADILLRIPQKGRI